MRESGHVPTTLVIIGSEGPLIVIPESMAREVDRFDFAQTTRLLCVAHVATVAVFVTEIRVVQVAPNVGREPCQPLSRSTVEYILVCGEGMNGIHRPIYYPVQRAANGEFAGFGKALTPSPNPFAEEPAKLLPNRPPTKIERTSVQSTLESQGILVGGFPPRTSWSE